MSTIHDVAEKAGVSIKTVLRVLSDANSVSEKTRRRIEHAMQALDVAPSAAARMLRGRQTDLVAVIADKHTTTPDSSAIIKGIPSVCEDLGKMLLIGETGGQAHVASRLVADMRTNRVEAIIFATTFHRPATLNEMAGQTPAVLANCCEETSRFAEVIRDEGGGYAAAETVLRAGRRKIAFLQLIEGMVATRLRLHGFRRAMQDHGVRPNEAWLLHGATPDSDDEFAQLKTTIDGLFAGADRPTAILRGNDKMAIRVIFLLQRRGLRVPEDASVVGCDDFRLLSEASDPGLTTITLPYREIGALAARRALGKDQEPGIVRVPCRAVMRGTVTAPRAGKAGN
ncbi:LacI family DNA-binding transcriptional regulator [Massilia luteola]|uniref:LacI family DNA-binding transcriptional regulator n=1 Tax=Massilia luteola TaxID=3081751 RepID=UPI002ACBE7B3|nr:LacI family DNA-binding transcriptional regulator [Massilia sp. Gc5]